MRQIGPEEIRQGRIDFAEDSLEQLRFLQSLCGQGKDGIRRARIVLEREWATIKEDGGWVTQHADHPRVGRLCVEFATAGDACLRCLPLGAWTRWRESILKRALYLLNGSSRRDSSTVRAILYDLAALYSEWDNLEAAEWLYGVVQRIAQVNLSKDDPELARILSTRGEVLTRMGRLEEAEPLLKEAWDILRDKYGEDHILVTGVLSNLAALHRCKSDFEEAERLYRKVLAIEEEKLGRSNHHSIGTLNNLAALCRCLGRLKEARSLFEQALDALLAAEGENGSFVPAAANNLAEVYHDMGHYDAAFVLLQAARHNVLANMTKDHHVLPIILNNLAALHQRIGENEEAERLYREALELLSGALPHRRRVVLARVVINLFRCDHALGRQNEAELLWSQYVKEGVPFPVEG